MINLPDSSKLQFQFPKSLQTICLVLIIVGVVMTLAQLFITEDAHHGETPVEQVSGTDHEAGMAGEATEEDHGWSNPRFFFSIHLALLIAIPLGLGGIYFTAFNHVSGAAWSVTIRRLAENSFWYIFVVLFLTVIVLIGVGDVFHHWVHAPETDELIAHKSGWLNVPRFVITNLLLPLIWILFGFIFWKKSTTQDQDGDIRHTRKLARFGAGFLVVFGLSYSISSWDLGMSLEPHWFSTLWALYFFAGLALTTFAVLILWVWYLKRNGYYGDVVNENHFHDLGKFMFGHTIFWAYMAVSQYMLIWYSHLPEEIIFFHSRNQGAWWYVSVFLVILRFVLPFFLLVKREWKRNYNYMAIISVLVLVGQIVDMYWILYPTMHHGDFIPFFWQEVGPLLFVFGSYVLVVGKMLERQQLIPVKDPRLEECLHFHQ